MLLYRGGKVPARELVELKGSLKPEGSLVKI